MLLYATLLAALNHPAAHAADARTSYCRPGTVILEKVEDCEQNSLFVSQAKECREALEKEVSKTSQGLAKLLAAGGSGDTQATNFGSTAKDYGATTAQLDNLLLLTSLAINDVSAYAGNVVQPEDIENPDIAGSDPQKFADSVPCYADTQKGIQDNVNRLTKMQAELTAARAGAVAFGGTANSRADQIQANDSLVAPTDAYGASATGGFTTHKKDPSKSDVSGTKKVGK